MLKKFKDKITTLTLVITIIGVAGSFCFLNLNPASAMEMTMDMGTYHTKKISSITVDYSARHTNLLCCQENNNNQNVSIISDSNVKISKLAIGQSITEENSLSNNSRSSQITLSSNNSPSGEALQTVIKKE
ncbi:MAG: hypothetical protein COU40_03930 [Candidatus Moranbacteria bacterium CG10_big_fil_rev_8_21_14_0_10_35_21]|nr:MAG: hypothetical protein COU40_03930 [Candidatus Moranbacteria bacterium CG10_big_fil_rev_8_21_14_0_10_35_21]PJA88417.1 MAG: hypothetical protein CO139_03295 [Candidatus Moranbacteria bacterium CG_4_9_14_3_um_filter_36_9]